MKKTEEIYPNQRTKIRENTASDHDVRPADTHTCPHCRGILYSSSTDFCKHCGKYIKDDICSFCGAPMDKEDHYCGECGAPHGLILCPTCGNESFTSFCGNCNEPLTETAREEIRNFQQTPLYQEVRSIKEEIGQLQQQLVPEKSAPQSHPKSQHFFVDRQTEEEKKAIIARKKKELEQIMEQFAECPAVTPVEARNYYMTQKPSELDMYWRCNKYKCDHRSPADCSAPEYGGQWHIKEGNEKLTVD